MAKGRTVLSGNIRIKLAPERLQCSDLSKLALHSLGRNIAPGCAIRLVPYPPAGCQKFAKGLRRAKAAAKFDIVVSVGVQRTPSA
ncbi:hypothetical protein AJ87_34965 [Rhizobium yanglingense]|nr:hypothetical protein AJ87_34965 [Rhizobium yanglingense]